MSSVNLFVILLFEFVESETNERGNGMRRKFYSSERYLVDGAVDFGKEGWEQFDTDQDASYFGFWVNRKRWETLTYCEGDWTHVACPTAESYNAEIGDAIRFYGEGRIMLTIAADGTQVVYRQDRSKFFIEKSTDAKEETDSLDGPGEEDRRSRPAEPVSGSG